MSKRPLTRPPAQRGRVCPLAYVDSLGGDLCRLPHRSGSCTSSRAAAALMGRAHRQRRLPASSSRAARRSPGPPGTIRPATAGLKTTVVET